MSKKIKQLNRSRGVAMILTIVLLVVLTTLVYTLGSRLSLRLHRDNYLIDYQNARYACDSAAKYSLAVIGEMKAGLIERPNEPDFSDLYRMDEEEYRTMVEEYLAAQEELYEEDSNEYNDSNSLAATKFAPKQLSFSELMQVAMATELPESNSLDPNDPNSYSSSSDSDIFSMSSSLGFEDDYNDVNEFIVRGPYGPKWPLAKEPIEFTIGDAVVTIEIQDENAKLPMVWALMNDEDYNKQANAAVESFMEWMQLEPTQIETIKKELSKVSEIKDYSTELPQIKVSKKVMKTVKTRERRSRSRRSRRSRRKTKTTQKEVTQTVPRADNLHLTDYSKLMNSSVVNPEILKTSAIESEQRDESAYKYISLWGTQKVNINTAPRHVLEAAFTFGGDEVEIADAIIEQRKIKPFESIEDLADQYYGYNDSIEKCKPFITTQSTIFTIRVNAYSGLAKASAIAAVRKTDKKVEKIAVISR